MTGAARAAAAASAKMIIGKDVCLKGGLNQNNRQQRMAVLWEANTQQGGYTLLHTISSSFTRPFELCCKFYAAADDMRNKSVLLPRTGMRRAVRCR